MFVTPPHLRKHAPKNGWFLVEYPTQMEDLGVPPFQETIILYGSICSICLQIPYNYVWGWLSMIQLDGFTTVTAKLPVAGDLRFDGQCLTLFRDPPST